MRDGQSAMDFRIYGMDCAEETAILKREVGPLAGGADNLAFDILKGKMTVLARAGAVDARQVTEAVARGGMRAEAWTDVQPGAAEADFARGDYSSDSSQLPAYL